MTDHPDRPGYSFNDGPPPEVSRFLSNKGLKPSFSWQDVEPEEHAVAFAVAKAGTVDVLTTIREEVQRAIDEGLPFREFQQSLQPRLEKLGWWGYGEVVDPDRGGQRRAARLGSPRRLRTIFDANLRSARAAGQWERIQRTKDALPYLEYRLGPSERHRPHHEAKQGLVLPADDPFWSQWYPPNGWGCKCWVRQLTEAEARRRGVSESPGVPTREWTNRRTGEVKRVPIGIDPGWERNPGAVRREAMEDILTGKLSAAVPEVARVVARDMAGSWRAQRVLNGTAGGQVPIAVLGKTIAEDLGASSGIVRIVDAYGKKIGAKSPPVASDVLVELADAVHRDGTILHEARAGAAPAVHVFTANRAWHMVLKLVPEKDELWVSTIHATTPRKTGKVMRRDGTRVVRE